VPVQVTTVGWTTVGWTTVVPTIIGPAQLEHDEAYTG